MPTPVTFSKLEVINQALGAMGEEPLSSISALSGTTKQAVIMRIHYEPVVYSSMTRSNWRFATAKAALNKLSAPPLNRWANAWQLPADMLKLITTWPISNYEIQNRQLLTQESTRVEVDYIRLVEEAYWPAWFMRYVVARLTARTIKGITGEDPDAALVSEMDEALRDALYQDSQQQPNVAIVANDFVDVRY